MLYCREADVVLPLDTLPDEPAGRLHGILSLFHEIQGAKTLSHMWSDIAPLVATGGDAISVRREAGSLLRDVDRAVYSLPQRRHKADSLLRNRPYWAKPIFSFEVNDTANSNPPEMISQAALDTLSTLSSVLQLASPEHRPSGTAEELDRVLDEVYEQLGQLRIEIETAEDLPDLTRIRLLSPITVALEKVTYVRIRGFSHLLGTFNVTALEVRAVIQEQAVEDPKRLKRFSSWLDVIFDVVRKIEKITLPPAIGIATGIASKDIALGFGSALTARLSLEGLKSPKEIESGDEGNEGKSE